MSKKKKMQKPSSLDEPSAAAKIKSRKEKKLQKPTDGLDEANKAMVDMAATLGDFVASPHLSRREGLVKRHGLKVLESRFG